MILKKQISDNMKISGVYKITNTVTVYTYRETGE